MNAIREIINLIVESWRDDPVELVGDAIAVVLMAICTIWLFNFAPYIDSIVLDWKTK